MTDEYKSLDNGLKELSKILVEVSDAFKAALELEMQKVYNIKKTLDIVREQQERENKAREEWEKANQNGSK